MQVPRLRPKRATLGMTNQEEQVARRGASSAEVDVFYMIDLAAEETSGETLEFIG
jgi:hypothetical protein